jgi:hypothetical protein
MCWSSETGSFTGFNPASDGPHHWSSGLNATGGLAGRYRRSQQGAPRGARSHRGAGCHGTLRPPGTRGLADVSARAKSPRTVARAGWQCLDAHPVDQSFPRDVPESRSTIRGRTGREAPNTLGSRIAAPADRHRASGNGGHGPLPSGRQSPSERSRLWRDDAFPSARAGLLRRAAPTRPAKRSTRDGAGPVMASH